MLPALIVKEVVFIKGVTVVNIVVDRTAWVYFRVLHPVLLVMFSFVCVYLAGLDSLVLLGSLI